MPFNSPESQVLSMMENTTEPRTLSALLDAYPNILPSEVKVLPAPLNKSLKLYHRAPVNLVINLINIASEADDEFILEVAKDKRVSVLNALAFKKHLPQAALKLVFAHMKDKPAVDKFLALHPFDSSNLIEDALADGSLTEEELRGNLNLLRGLCTSVTLNGFELAKKMMKSPPSPLGKTVIARDFLEVMLADLELLGLEAFLANWTPRTPARLAPAMLLRLVAQQAPDLAPSFIEMMKREGRVNTSAELFRTSLRSQSREDGPQAFDAVGELAVALLSAQEVRELFSGYNFNLFDAKFATEEFLTEVLGPAFFSSGVSVSFPRDEISSTLTPKVALMLLRNAQFRGSDVSTPLLRRAADGLNLKEFLSENLDLVPGFPLKELSPKDYIDFVNLGFSLDRVFKIHTYRLPEEFLGYVNGDPQRIKALFANVNPMAVSHYFSTRWNDFIRANIDILPWELSEEVANILSRVGDPSLFEEIFKTRAVTSRRLLSSWSSTLSNEAPEENMAAFRDALNSLSLEARVEASSLILAATIVQNTEDRILPMLHLDWSSLFSIDPGTLNRSNVEIFLLKELETKPEALITALRLLPSWVGSLEALTKAAKALE